MTSSNIAFTQIDVKKTQFTWKISNFTALSASLLCGSKLDSPKFTVKPDDGMKWHLSVWPNGVNSNYSAFLSISLACSFANSFNVHTKITMSVKDIRGRKWFRQNTITDNSSVTLHEFIPKNLLAFENNGILLNDGLTVYCELTVMYKDSIQNVESIQQNPVNLTDKILIAFEQQLEKGEFSDVKLVASCGKELRAHKFILAARSPVFSAMFSNDMIEKNDNSVVIKDLDYDSLKEMLRFMYAGRVEHLDKVVDGVLVAQEKYQIGGLKELCEEYFFQNINVENVIEILIFSIRHNLDKIKLLAKKIIRCHAKEVSTSAAFKAIDEPDLLAEIVNILADVS